MGCLALNNTRSTLRRRGTLDRSKEAHRLGDDVNALWRTWRGCIYPSFFEDIHQAVLSALRPKGCERNAASELIKEKGSPSTVDQNPDISLIR